VQVAPSFLCGAAAGFLPSLPLLIKDCDQSPTTTCPSKVQLWQMCKELARQKHSDDVCVWASYSHAPERVSEPLYGCPSQSSRAHTTPCCTTSAAVQLQPRKQWCGAATSQPVLSPHACEPKPAAGTGNIQQVTEHAASSTHTALKDPARCQHCWLAFQTRAQRSPLSWIQLPRAAYRGRLLLEATCFRGANWGVVIFAL
jgi:hypothetical protein